VKFEALVSPLLVQGNCPPVVDLSNRQIVRGIKFDRVSGAKILNFEAARLEGGLSIILPTVDQIILRHATILPFIKILREDRKYQWIDDSPDDDSCMCDRDHERARVKVIDASYLVTNNFEMHAVSVERFLFRRADVNGLIDISRCELGQSTFHQTRARGIDINSCELNGSLEAAQVEVSSNLTLECSTVRKNFSLWGARIGGMVHLQGTRFYSGDFTAFSSRFGQLGFGSTEGAIRKMRLDKSEIGTIDLQADVCPRKLQINSIKANGIKFDWVDGSLESPPVKKFFDSVKMTDASVYRKLADAYVSAGQFDLADEAMIYHEPIIGWARWIGGSGVLAGWIVVLLLLCVPVLVWSATNWPNGATFSGRIVLAADLLLPDLVSLGAKERYKEELGTLDGIKLLLIAIYRLLGWLIISIIIYAVVTRGNY
jgi:hypothetical protein